jgi:hypothetical protein
LLPRSSGPTLKLQLRHAVLGPEIEAIYRKWFEAPVPPNGLNFKTPMSAVLHKAFAKPLRQSGPGKLRALSGARGSTIAWAF